MQKNRGQKKTIKLEAASGQRCFQMAWDFLTTPFLFQDIGLSEASMNCLFATGF
jgi:hypothetical protein